MSICAAGSESLVPSSSVQHMEEGYYCQSGKLSSREAAYEKLHKNQPVYFQVEKLQMHVMKLKLPPDTLG